MKQLSQLGSKTIPLPNHPVTFTNLKNTILKETQLGHPLDWAFDNPSHLMQCS